MNGDINFIVGTVKEMFCGLLLGFFLGVLNLFWFKETVFTRRHQMGILYMSSLYYFFLFAQLRHSCWYAYQCLLWYHSCHPLITGGLALIFLVINLNKLFFFFLSLLSLSLSFFKNEFQFTYCGGCSYLVYC